MDFSIGEMTVYWIFNFLYMVFWLLEDNNNVKECPYLKIKIPLLGSYKERY